MGVEDSTFNATSFDFEQRDEWLDLMYEEGDAVDWG